MCVWNDLHLQLHFLLLWLEIIFAKVVDQVSECDGPVIQVEAYVVMFCVRCPSGMQLNNKLLQLIGLRFADENYDIDFDDYLTCIVRLENMFSTLNTTLRWVYREQCLNKWEALYEMTLCCSHSFFNWFKFILK